jgi:hypothetical protein
VQPLSNDFSSKLKYVIAMARAEAHRVACENVTPEHMLFALSFGSGYLATILQAQGVTTEALRDNLPIWSRLSAHFDVPLSKELSDLLDFASELSASDPLKQVTPEHVLKALLVEDAAFSVVPILKALNVDVESLRMRTDINTYLMERPEVKEPTDRVFKVRSSEGSQSWQSSVAGEGCFDKYTGALIQEAWVYSRVMGPSIPEWQSLGQTSMPPGFFKRSELGIHHLLSAFKKQGLLPDYMNKILSLIEERNLFEAVLNANFEESIKLQDDAKSALLSARMLASASTDGLITPLMLLFGIVSQFDSILYTNADLEQLGHVSQQIREELATDLEKIHKLPDLKFTGAVHTSSLVSETNSIAPGPAVVPALNSSHFLLTQRLIRVLRFAKEEALLVQQPLVWAPHLVLAILREALNSEVTFVTNRAFDSAKLRIAVSRANDFIRLNTRVEANLTTRLAPESRGFLLLARDKAYELKSISIDVNHLALALLETQKWLRELVDTFTGSNFLILARRLEKCSVLHQDAGYSSSIGLVVSLDEVDDRIEPWSEQGVPPTTRTVEDRLSRRSEIVLKHAILETKKFCHTKISVETIMLGLLYETFGPTYDAFSLLDLNLLEARKIIAASCTRSSTRSSPRTSVPRRFSVNALRLMERAWEFSLKLKVNRIEPEHIVLAIAEEEHGVASFVCEALAIRGSLLRTEMIAALSYSKKCSVSS